MGKLTILLVYIWSIFVSIYFISVLNIGLNLSAILAFTSTGISISFICPFLSTTLTFAFWLPNWLVSALVTISILWILLGKLIIEVLYVSSDIISPLLTIICLTVGCSYLSGVNSSTSTGTLISFTESSLNVTFVFTFFIPGVDVSNWFISTYKSHPIS